MKGKDKPRADSEPQELPTERPCFGCKKPFLGISWQHLCADCHEELLENLAVKLDPTYDRKIMHDWEQCERALRRLYGWWDEWDDQRERAFAGELMKE